MAMGPPEKMLLLRMPHSPVSLICCSSLCRQHAMMSRDIYRDVYVCQVMHCTREARSKVEEDEERMAAELDLGPPG